MFEFKATFLNFSSDSFRENFDLGFDFSEDEEKFCCFFVFVVVYLVRL